MSNHSDNRDDKLDVQKLQKRVEELERLNRRNELICGSAGEGIFGLDMQGNFIFMNKAAATMLGYTPEECIGRHSHSCMHYIRSDDSRYPEEECKTYAAFRDGIVRHVDDECFCRKDGTRFPVEYTSTPIMEGNEIVGAVVTFSDITERKRAEETLKLTQFSVDHASVSAFLVDRDARILYVNEQACRTLGYSREELLTLTVHDLDPNVPVSAWDDRWTQIKKEGPLHFETQHLKKDGTPIPVEISVNYVSFGGRVYNWAFAQDISERKQAENQLRHAYSLTKTIIDSMNDAISLIDVRDFTIVRVNKAFLQSYGYSDESEITGKHCYEITHHRPDVCSAPDDICPLVESVKTRGYFAADHVHYDKRGEKIYVEVSTSPIKDEAGNVIQVVHIQRNITERKKAEEALRESEERFRAFFEMAAVGTTQVDPATMRFLRTNQRFCEMTGYSCEELRSMTFNDLTHPDDKTLDEERFRETLGPSAPTYETEKRYIRKDGRVVWVHVSAIVVHDSQGRPLHTAAIVQDITDRKKMEEEIRHMAHHDTLTGLPNRRLFRDIFEIEVAQARRNRKKLAILFLDLDRFKEINDTLGHEVGDELLKLAAALFRDAIRESDTVARIGGDEFNILLADLVRPESISDIAQKIINRFRSPFSISGHELNITTSIGISVYPDDSKDIDTLLRYADIAMYSAKEAGRNTYRFFNPAISIRTIERMRLENMLRRSIALGELVMYYQPTVDIKNRRMICAEALIRWRHPDKGFLTPEHFIPMAEEMGFITEIDEWVLRTVCGQITSWSNERLSPICVTVNLSARMFQDPELVHKISSVLRETGAFAQCLDLEITETTAMSNVERTASKLLELREMGIHISIDDFGTGYSSLNYLKKLPIERLKIDQSFIRDIATDPDDRAIIGAVTSMAHKMGIRTVAEGVETEEQLAFLRVSECDEAQGYLFSRPVPAERFRELVEAGT